MEQRRAESTFDEQAALEELERLRRAIVEYRHERTEAEAAFEDFVRSFREQAPVPEPQLPPPAVRRGPRASAAIPAAPAPIAPAPQERAPVASLPPIVAPPPPPLPDVPIPASSLADADVAQAPPPLRKPARVSRRIVIAAIPLAVMVAASAWLIRSPRDVPSTAPGPPPAAAVTPPAPVAAPPAAAATTTAPQVPAAVVTTLRRVWVRVIVDGKREVERELAADARIPLSGRTIVIRTGDAGAVRVEINGQDRGPLGRDGEVVTRTFTTGGE